jgi:hypothetical protein
MRARWARSAWLSRPMGGRPDLICLVGGAHPEIEMAADATLLGGSRTRRESSLAVTILQDARSYPVDVRLHDSAKATMVTVTP